MHKKKNGGESSVGYKKPPRHTQFKPGQSGNPKGRPKKVATLTDIFSKELRQRVPLMKDGKRQMISMLEAIVKQCLNKAAKGDSKAVALIFNLLKEGNSGGRNNLSDLVHEFRARYGGLVASDKGQLTDVGINGENGM